jgi:hypothetical protein
MANLESEKQEFRRFSTDGYTLADLTVPRAKLRKLLSFP